LIELKPKASASKPPAIEPNAPAKAI
jgi:hypothetical protein